ncbi:DUF732 domain-containing protein [Nocardia sp. NPDC004711]
MGLRNGRFLPASALAAATIAVAVAAAGSAHADQDTPTRAEREQAFIDGIIRMGLIPANPTAHLRSESIGLGWGVCQGLDRGLTTAGEVIVLSKTYSEEDAAMWVAIATTELCPEYS